MGDLGIFSTLYSRERDILKPVYFDVAVLERYFSNPKYLVFYSDYRGSIILNDDYVDKSVDNFEYLKHFGIAYDKNNRNKKAIVAFADELIQLPNKMQSHFYSYIKEKQDDYIPNNGFVQNLIFGKWIDTISIFQALSMEIHYINKMCDEIKLPKMFKKEFPTEARLQNERPDNYHSILLPTEKNYYDFVITLEKMITGNLNVKTFTTTVATILPVERKFEDGKDKGTLTLLVEWLNSNIKLGNIKADIEKPLRELISERQKPAHEIVENRYDDTIWQRQDDFMIKIYTAVRYIRILLATHPKAKSVIIPQYLFDGEHIVIY